jgi:hypothetical protein
MKRAHLALGVLDAEVSQKDYSQRLGCRPALLIPKVCVVAHGCGQPVDPESGPRRGGARRGHGSGDVVRSLMLSSSDYLDGVLGRPSLLFICASESICLRALS